jgi:DNA-binding transcriptional ArsR family regulator
VNTSLQVLKSDLFRALAHPARIRILEVLATGERSVQALQQAVGLEQPLVSQHLAVLRAKHVVVARRDGALAYYALGSPIVSDLLRDARLFLSDRLIAQGSMLRELRRQGRRERRA